MKYYQYNQWQTIDDNIDYSQGIQTTSRIDDAFETCTFKAYLSNVLPIPPYTLFKDGSTLWVGKSRITQYLTENNLYVHEFELLEPSAFLKCFIIGVKVYSEESPTWGQDSEKVKSLLAQAQRMYPDYTFDYGSIGNRIRTSKTYTFSATDTLYDCLNQICQENDVKLVVTFENDDPYKLIINFKSVVYGTYNINDSGLRIINHTENQDAENYGRFLETYASNVVDRTTITKCEALEFKANNEVALNADSAYFRLPTPIDTIVEFGVNQTQSFNVDIRPDAYFDKFSFSTVDTPYSSLAQESTTIGGQTVYFFEDLFNNYFASRIRCSKADFYSNVTYKRVDEGSVWTVQITIPSSVGMRIQILNILEKTQWDLLTPQDQATYAVYTIGSNKIENLNGKYKNDLWDWIIGQSRGNFLSVQSTIMLNNPPTIYGVPFYLWYFNANGYLDTDFFHYQFYVDYHPLTNPYIRDKKTDSSYNEYNFKPISRSYGVSANYIDFDKIIPNMAISNNTLGQIEKVYEVDLTGVTDTSLNNPQAGNTVTLSSGTWYVSSCIRTKKFSGGKDTAVLTIVKNYSKKADSIGVDSQTETTNNPLKGITTRPIYMEYQMPSSADFSMFDNDAWYLKMVFYDNNDTAISNTVNGTTQSDLYIRCAVQRYNNVVYLCAETMDQMIFDYAKGAAQTGYTELVPCAYTDSKAESGYVAMSFGKMAMSTTAMDFNLPLGGVSSFNTYANLLKVRIDKDAREHLTFTLKLYK